MAVNIERWNQVAGDIGVYAAIKKTDDGTILNGVAVKWTPKGGDAQQFIMRAEEARAFGKAVLNVAEGQLPPEAGVN